MTTPSTKSDISELENSLKNLPTPSSAALEMIKVEKVGEKKNVGLITLNRPKALNALCKQLMDEVSGLSKLFFWNFEFKIRYYSEF